MKTDKLKEEKQDLCHLKLIEMSRKILENRLNNEKNYINQDTYNIFVISAFLLVKENLIKKDSLNDILYFDYNNQEYIPYILELAKKISQKDYQRNSTTIEIQNNSLANNKLKESIWLVNKIRDSLAHGVYEIKEDKIIIDNDHTDELNSYKLTTTLDIDDLANFVLSTITKTKVDRNKIFKYTSPILRLMVEEEHMYLSFNGRQMKICYGDPKKRLKHSQNLIRIYISVRTENEENKIYIENYDEIIAMLKKNRNFVGRLEYAIEETKNLIEKDCKEKELAIKASYIISKVTEYFNSSNIENTIDYIYLYNYMSLVFTYNNEEKVELPNLDLTNISINTSDIDYKNMEMAITKIVNDSTKKIKKSWKIYEDHKDVVPIEIVNNKMLTFYTKIKDKTNSINNIVIKSIRNGIEHANFNEENSLIKITDKPNQNSNEEKSTFIGTVWDFYNLTSYVEKQKLAYIDETFDISLLEKHLPTNTFIDLIYGILNEEYSIINKENKSKIKTK